MPMLEGEKSVAELILAQRHLPQVQMHDQEICTMRY